MKKFVARETELTNLNEMYQSPNFEMAVVYGRRRVGKTSLIKEFIKNKPSIYIQGIEATKELNLQYLSDAIMDFENPGRINTHFSFNDFRDAFTEVENIANNQKEKLVFVLDEFPYFAESAPEVSSILQYTIDHIYKEYNNVMLILCGSSMSFMEHQVLGIKSPLYGRRTGQFKIRPFNIFDTKKMLPDIDNEDLLAYYGITGGVPQYLTFIDQRITVSENINKLFLKQNAPLQNETNILLQEELRKPATYYSILVAIANGKTKVNKIYQAIGLKSSSQLSPYLNKLMELEIIERKSPILDTNSKNGIYAIKDNMFKFWFKFISGEQDQIALGRTNGVLEAIMKELPRFLGPIFEQASMDWLWKQSELPFEPRSIKSWWGYNPVLKRQDEIDIVAVNFDNSEAIVGECKWRNSDKLSREMLTTLRNRAELFGEKNTIKNKYLYFFVKKDNNDFKERAKKQNVRVISYGDFFD
ncbi:ATP-binding protein [Lactobacillus hamsteri]|nr:ATP-binding protein [Lactobacillus hamsteri]